MSEPISTITGKTLIPISLLVSLGGGAGWLTSIYSTTQATAKTLEEVKSEISDIRHDLSTYKLENSERVFEALLKIDSRLSRIEAKIP